MTTNQDVTTEQALNTSYVDGVLRMKISSEICKIVFHREQKGSNGKALQVPCEEIVMPTNAFLQMISKINLSLKENKDGLLQGFDLRAKETAMLFNELCVNANTINPNSKTRKAKEKKPTSL